MKRILIIDDDKRFRLLLSRLLKKRFRLEVSEANNGLEGLELFKKERPNLIFLDITMPVMDGLEFLTHMREIDKDTPVVIISCVSHRDCVQQIVQLGISDYVVKAETVLRLEERLFEIFEKNKSAFK